MVLITNNATLPNKRSTRVSGPLQKVSERESVFLTLAILLLN
jgi:hypothetical protein